MEQTFRAGERVPAGLYRQIDSRRMVRLHGEDYLPASLDGRVACYERIDDTWEQIRRRPCRLAEET